MVKVFVYVYIVYKYIHKDGKLINLTNGNMQL